MAGFDILIREQGGEWVHPASRKYKNERDMQELLAANPNWIPGVEGKAIVALEISTMAGPADICVLTDDGSITVIECKLQSNSENRRMVIGQVLDYASAISTSGPEALRASWRKAADEDPQEILGTDTWGQVTANLRSGTLNLCLAVDTIDQEIRRLVGYLNKITIAAVAVTALELQYAKHDEFEVLVPTVFGEELAAAKSTKWNASDVVRHLKTHENAAIAVFVETFIEACIKTGCYVKEGVGVSPSIIISCNAPNGQASPFAIYCAPPGSSGTLMFNFEYTSCAPEFARLEFARRIVDIVDIGLTVEALTELKFGKRPSVSLESLSSISEISARLAAAQEILHNS